MTGRDRFLDALAWACVAAGILKLAAFALTLNILDFAAPLGGLGLRAARYDLPAWLRFASDHARAVAFADGAAAAAAVLAGAGLLRRERWASRLLEALLLAGVARWSYALLVQAAIAGRMSPPPIRGLALRAAFAGIGAATIAVGAGFIAAYLWLFVRLRSPDTLAEFGPK